MIDDDKNEKTETPADALPVTDAAKVASAPAAKAEIATAAPTPVRAKPAPRAKTRKATRARSAKPPVAARNPQPAKPASKPVRAARRAVRSINSGVKTMANTTHKAAETGQIAAEQFRAAFGDINERTKTAVEKSAKIVEELADLTRGNVEALVASSKVAAKGVEILAQDAADYGRKSFEGASAAFKSFAEVKTAADFLKLQSDYARSAFDAAVAETARLSETVLKLANDVAEPINSRYAVAAQRVKTLAA